MPGSASAALGGADEGGAERQEAVAVARGAFREEDDHVAFLEPMGHRVVHLGGRPAALRGR